MKKIYILRKYEHESILLTENSQNTYIKTLKLENKNNWLTSISNEIIGNKHISCFSG